MQAELIQARASLMPFRNSQEHCVAEKSVQDKWWWRSEKWEQSGEKITKAEKLKELERTKNTL